MIDHAVLLFGPPGCGKGTQAKRLSKTLGLPHVSTGDMFRDHRERRTELGLAVEHLMSRGELVPDAVTNDMVRERLLRPDLSAGVILDGFPRNVDQARWLRRFLADRGLAVRAVLVLEVPDAELIARIQGRAAREGRSDDADEAVIRHRLATYADSTAACVGYFRTEGVRVHVVDGVGTPDQVEARLAAPFGA
jgi:adenylate kinase